MRWTNCTLGDVMTLKRGHDLPRQSRQDGEVPIVSSSGVTGFHNESKADAPGVVTGRYGTLGEVYFIRRAFWPLNTALYVTDFKGNDAQFVAYFLKNAIRDYSSDKAAVPGVDRNVLHRLNVRLPDRSCQERIADVLSAYDDLIENNRRRIALLEQAARELYQEWFVRLRFPGYESTRIVDGVPEGWERKTYADSFSFLGGFAFKSKTYEQDGEYGIVTIKNVHDAQFVPECPSKLDYVPEKMKEHCALATGDILLSLTGNVGRSCVVFGRNYLLNQRVAKVVGSTDIPKSYTYWTFSNKITQKELENLAHGVAQLNLSPVILGQRSLLKPSSSLLRSFEEIADPILWQITTLNLKIVQLRQARDVLLPPMMSGEVAV